MNSFQKMTFELSDGSKWHGYSFGYNGSASGEAIFNTAMNGYPESLTDPSYKGQILVITFPLVGNYGVPEDKIVEGLSAFYESEQIHISGLVVSQYSFDYSHWNAKKSLSQWLKEHKIPALFGVDTRAITRHLREVGAMPARLYLPDNQPEFLDVNKLNLVDHVSCKNPTLYGKGANRILLIDTGVKHNILRCLLRRDTTVLRVPWDYDFSNEEYDAIFLSNGPGDPTQCQETINSMKRALNESKPIFGICLGSQIMALAAGATTYKLKYGHRGHNQPVRLYNSDKCYITSQNHGFAVDMTTLPKSWTPLFYNLNDNSCEGIKHESLPFFSVQFHPEASGGPSDTEFLFDDFINLVIQSKNQ